MKRQPARFLSILVFALTGCSHQVARSQPAIPLDSNVSYPAAPSASVVPVSPSLSETLSGAAKADYESGKPLSKDGDFSGALLESRQNHQESHDGRPLWNMAVCEKDLRLYSRARQLVEQRSKDAATMSAPEREEETELLGVAKSLVGPLTAAIDPVDRVVPDTHQPAQVAR